MDFARLCNAETFEATMLARGVVRDSEARQWEVAVEGGSWSPYSVEQNEAIEMARLQGRTTCEVYIRSWRYQIDLQQLVQRNAKTQKARPIRSVAIAAGQVSAQGQVLHADLKAAVATFVELHTLAAVPTCPLRDAGTEAAVLPHAVHGGSPHGADSMDGKNCFREVDV